jgi:copper homeostasis protein
MRNIVFELCAQSVEACVVARDSGADRIELCSAMSEDGLTPSHGLTRVAIQSSGLPVYPLLRPRGGDFLYSDSEFAVIQEDLLHLRSLGVSGFALGLLQADGAVDVARTRELVEMAGPLEVTFHRAFDYTASLEQALEDVIATGCKRVLTSGGEADVVAGVDSLARLVRQAAGRIEIAVGGGLRLEESAEIARVTGARHFHGSLRRTEASSMRYIRQSMLQHIDEPAYTVRTVVEADDVRSLIESLRSA